MHVSGQSQALAALIRKQATDTHWIGDQIGHRTCLGAVEKVPASTWNRTLVIERREPAC
jgi:hypothetical protein